MGETKKVGSTGRFGARYGAGIRKKLLKIEPQQLQKQRCPNCGASTLRRRSKGIFRCRKCSHEFVGGAYLPKTLTGSLILQMVSQKKFSPEMLETTAPKGNESPEGAPEEASGEKTGKMLGKETRKETAPARPKRKTRGTKKEEAE